MEVKKQNWWIKGLIGGAVILGLAIPLLFTIFTQIPKREILKKAEPKLLEKARKYLIQGEKYFTLGEFDKAISELTKAIELDPWYAEAYYKRGCAELVMGDIFNAERDFHIAIKMKQEYEACLLDMLDKMLSECNESIELNPENTKAYYDRGNVYFIKGEHDKAINDYTKAIELDPGCGGAYLNRGEILFDSGEYDKAISDYTKTIELKPAFYKGHYDRGYAYLYNKKEYDKALNDFNKAIELKPNFAWTYYNRGLTYANLEQHDKAILDYTKALKMMPKQYIVLWYDHKGLPYINLGEYGIIYYRRGTSYLKLWKIEEARKDFDKTIELSPDYKKEVMEIFPSYQTTP